MLARNAESLYWIGRYFERADNTARILDVAVHQLLEDMTLDRDASSRFLFQVLGITPPATVKKFDAFSLAEAVSYNRDFNSGSIYDAITHARENARGAREVTSTELWECVNTTYNSLSDKEKQAKRLGPHTFFSYIKNQAAMFNGLADSTLLRDDGYRFLILGRSLERIDMTVRMLLSCVAVRINAPLWISVLRSAGAQDIFNRTYRGSLRATKIVEFMVLNQLFPRSVFHAINLAEHCVDALDQGHGSRSGMQDSARKILGRARSELEFVDLDVLDNELPQLLAHMQDVVRRVNDAVRKQYFYVEPYVMWTDARARDLVQENEIL